MPTSLWKTRFPVILQQTNVHFLKGWRGSCGWSLLQSRPEYLIARFFPYSQE